MKIMASTNLRDVTLISITSSCVEELRGYVVQRGKRKSLVSPHAVVDSTVLTTDENSGFKECLLNGIFFNHFLDELEQYEVYFYEIIFITL